MRGLPSSFKTFARGAGKVVFAVAVFAAVIGGYFFFTTYQRANGPLPGKVTSGGRCTLWLVGSSSLHRWDSADRDLPGWQVYNRGIEGARLPELQRRLRHSSFEPVPAAIILYAGENDLADGTDAASVGHGLKRIVHMLHRRTPSAALLIVSMKPSPTRWITRPAQIEVDAQMRRFAQRIPGARFVEAGERLLRNGHPGDYYNDDGIHLTANGYAVWSVALAEQLRGLPGGTCAGAR